VNNLNNLNDLIQTLMFLLLFMWLAIEKKKRDIFERWVEEKLDEGDETGERYREKSLDTTTEDGVS